MDFKNCVLAQFTIGKNKQINVLRENKIAKMVSNRYVQNTTFYGVTGGSKYGNYYDPNATHWGVFDMSDPDNPKLLIYDKFEETPRIRKVYKLGDSYAVMRKVRKFFSFKICEYPSVNELKAHSKS
jgi:hypothetical protein